MGRGIKGNHLKQEALPSGDAFLSENISFVNI
mgnify:FL=1